MNASLRRSFLTRLLLVHAYLPVCSLAHSKPGWFIASNVDRFRGGASLDSPEVSIPLPSDEIQLNLEAHNAEIVENTRNNSYHHGPCEKLPPGLLKTKGYNVGNVTLPDFDKEFRQSRGNELVQVTTKPLLSTEECDKIVTMAAKHFDSIGGWTSLPSGRYEIAGSWIKDIPTVRTFFNQLLKTKLFPAISELFPDVVKDASLLCVQSAYLFKYTPESGEKTDMHMDSSLLSFTILLNEEQDFCGGGTFFEALGEKGEIVPMSKGHVTFRPAGLRHRGQPITSGQRYVIGGFVTLAGRENCEHTRQLLTRGTKALADGDTSTARRLFELARDYNPRFPEVYMSVAHCLRKFDDAPGALKSYMDAFEANPRSADAAFMVGVMHGELQHDVEAMEWYRTATQLNEFDGDAFYRQGLILGRRGDVHGERSMYERAILVQPNHADAYCNLGVIFGEDGDSQKEIECYERALEIEPTNEEALNNAKAAYYYKGVNAYQAGDLDASLASFKRILDVIEPGEPSVVQAYEAVLKKKLESEQ